MARVPRQSTCDREQRAWSLRLQGRMEQAIAALVGMSSSGIHRLLVRVERRLRHEILAETSAELQQIDPLQAIHDRATASFEASCKRSQLLGPSVGDLRVLHVATDVTLTIAKIADTYVEAPLPISLPEMME